MIILAQCQSAANAKKHTCWSTIFAFLKSLAVKNIFSSFAQSADKDIFLRKIWENVYPWKTARKT